MNDFLEKPVGQLFARFLPAAIISLLISTVASLIDTVVVSYFVGPEGLSAVNICMPIYSLLSAVSLLIVGGAGTIFSQLMGKNDEEGARKVFTLAAVILFIIGIVYTIFGVTQTDTIVRFLGANDAIFDMSRDYAKVLFFFVIVNILFPLLQTFVRIDLDPQRTIVAIVVCAAVNMCLDVLLVGPFLTPAGMGTKGAAYATGIAYCVSFVILLLHFVSKKNTLKMAKKFYSASDVKRIIVTGIPASITLFGSAITMTVFNNFIITHGNTYGVGVGELYVSVYSVIVQVMTISMAVYVGIAQCSQPFFASNFGAKRGDRMKELFKTGMCIEIIGNLVLMIVLWVMASKIAAVFSMDAGAYDMTDVAVLAIRVFALSLVFTGVNQMILYLLQTSNYVLESSMISFMAGTLFLIIGLFLIAGVILKGNPDALGVWLSYLFAQLCTLVYSVFVFLKRKDTIFSMQ